MSEAENLAKNLAKANALLAGKKIKLVRQITPAEAAENLWYKLGPVIELEDGTLLIAQSDDEGNNAALELIDAGVITVQAVKMEDNITLYTTRP